MVDKNGRAMTTGQIVKIENAYFKVDNGLYFIEHTPGDYNWTGNYFSLRKIKRNGEISTAKYSLGSWPIKIYTNDASKRADGNAHNAKYATIEIIDNIPTNHIKKHFMECAENMVDLLNDYKWRFGETSDIYKQHIAIQNQYRQFAH